MLLHSVSDSVQAAREYFSFTLTLQCRAIHTSSGVEWLFLTFPLHFSASVLMRCIILVLPPLGAIQTPSICATLSHHSLDKETRELSTLVATRSM